MQRTLKKDLKLKSGETISKGTLVNISFSDYLVVLETESGRTIRIKASGAYRYLRGFDKPPTMPELERMLNDAICETVTGETQIEPDGYGLDGSPAWPIALGII